MTEIGSLAGVTLIHSPDTLVFADIDQFPSGSVTRQRIEVFQEAERQTMEAARRYGATILCAAEDDAYPTGPGVYWQARTYSAAHAVTQRILDDHRDSISDLSRLNIAELTDESQVDVLARLAGGERFVLAYKLIENGHMKYGIDEPWQLERFLAFVAQAGERVNPRSFELRPFIETPSDHFTSFRMVVDATGALLAAGIHYSSHKKQGEPQQVVLDRFSDCRPGTTVKFIKDALEDPKSEWYIGAKDVRSNSSCGGKIIPLMGNNRKPLNKREEGILEAHEIDPVHPQPPQRLADIAQLIGKAVGPHVHLVLGVDFIGDRHSETNFGPGGGVFAACHLEGGGTMLERYLAMRMSALANIAVVHS